MTANPHNHQPQSYLVKKVSFRRIGHFLLLEVLISFALVVLAVLPLIYPHFYIYQEQRAFIHKINLDMAVNLIYVNLVEKLHKNEIPWMDIQNDRVMHIDENLLKQAGYEKPFPYEGTYQFHLLKTKKNPQYALNRVELTLRFLPKTAKKNNDNKASPNSPLTYKYELFIAQLKAVPEAVSP